MPRRALADVDADRDLTLRAAVEVASVVGLEGLTLGRLAEQLGMSKSGLAGRFADKLELQLETLALACEMFQQAVYEPARREPAGLRRLGAICDRWIGYLGEPCFPGGCFLTTVSVEFDAREEGPVRDAVQQQIERWLSVLERQARAAVRAGQLPGTCEPAAVAFALNALAIGTNCDYQLRHRRSTLVRGRAAMAAVLGE